MNNNQKEILQLLKIFHIVCLREEIKYSISFGTLLGAVRHRGFIDHDDDADVIVFKDDEERLLDIFENEPLLSIAKFHSGYKIFFKDKLPINNKYSWGSPYVDIWIVDWSRNNHTYIYSNAKGFKNAIHYRNDLYPTRLYKFENIRLFGPRNPYPFLDKKYQPCYNHGVAWHEGIVSHNWDHEKEKPIKKKIIKLFSEEERQRFFDVK